MSKRTGKAIHNIELVEGRLGRTAEQALETARHVEEINAITKGCPEAARVVRELLDTCFNAQEVQQKQLEGVCDYLEKVAQSVQSIREEMEKLNREVANLKGAQSKLKEMSSSMIAGSEIGINIVNYHNALVGEFEWIARVVSDIHAAMEPSARRARVAALINPSRSQECENQNGQ